MRLPSNLVTKPNEYRSQRFRADLLRLSRKCSGRRFRKKKYEEKNEWPTVLDVIVASSLCKNAHTAVRVKTIRFIPYQRDKTERECVVSFSYDYQESPGGEVVLISSRIMNARATEQPRANVLYPSFVRLKYQSNQARTPFTTRTTGWLEFQADTQVTYLVIKFASNCLTNHFWNLYWFIAKVVHLWPAFTTFMAIIYICGRYTKERNMILY